MHYFKDTIAKAANDNSTAKNHVKTFLRHFTFFLKEIYFHREGDTNFRQQLTNALTTIKDGKISELLIELKNNKAAFYNNYSHPPESTLVHLAPPASSERILSTPLPRENTTSLLPVEPISSQPLYNSTNKNLDNVQSSATPELTGNKKPTLTLHLGDYLELLRKIDNSYNKAAQNAANPFHPCGAATYGQGSAEEAFARYSNLLIEMIVNTLKGERQKQALILIFSTLLKIADIGEEAFFNSTLYDDYVKQIIAIIRRDEPTSYHINYNSDKPSERCHEDHVFLLNTPINVTIEDLIKKEYDNPQEIITPVHVTSIAAIDKRVATGTTNLLTALSWKVGYDDLYIKITEQLITDTLQAVIRSQQHNPGKTAVFIMLPIGCGAFLGDPTVVANCYVNVLKKYSDDIHKYNIQLVMASFPDNYRTIANIFLDKLQNEFNIVQNAQNYVHDDAKNKLQLIPEYSAKTPHQCLVSLADMDMVRTPDAFDVVVLSTNTNLNPAGTTFTAETSLIGQLTTRSPEFATACRNQPQLRSGQFADMGNFIFQRSRKATQILLTITNKFNPNDIEALMDSYVKTLCYINHQYQNKNDKTTVALTLFGTGHHNWPAQGVLELAAFVIRTLLNSGLLPNIKQICLVNYGLKDLKIIKVFENAIQHAPLTFIPQERFNKWWDKTNAELNHDVVSAYALEPRRSIQTPKQNATVFFTFTDSENKTWVLVTNKNISASLSRQIKTAVFNDHSYDTAKTPGGCVDVTDLVTFTAMKELQEETNIDCNKLTAVFNNATIAYVGTETVNGNQALHAYWIDLGKLLTNPAALIDYLNIIARDDINNIAFFELEKLIQPEFLCTFGDKNEVKKIFDPADKKLLLVIKNNRDTIKKYLMSKVITCFDPEKKLEGKVLGRLRMTFDSLPFDVCETKIEGQPNLKVAFITGYHNVLTESVSGEMPPLYQGEKPITTNDLARSYYQQFTQLIDKGIQEIHTVLVGAGNLEFSIEECINAFLEGLHRVKLNHDTAKKGLLPKIFLHIPDTEHYQEAAKLLNKISHDFIDYKSYLKTVEIKKFYTVTSPDFSRKKRFESGHATTVRKTTYGDTWKPWTEITTHLYLGKIPTKAEAIRLKQLFPNIELDVALLEDFEVGGIGLIWDLEIQTALEWLHVGVRQLQLVAQDIRADDFPIYEFIRTLVKTKQILEAGKAVYVHCRAGRSRSATFILCYLYLFGDKKNNIEPLTDLKILHQHLTKLRPEVSLHACHYDVIYKVKELVSCYPELLNPIKSYSGVSTIRSVGDLHLALNQYFADILSKNDIMQLCWFKELKRYAMKNPDKLTEAQEILDKLFAAKTAENYHTLLKNNKLTYISIVLKELYSELVQHLAAVFNRSSYEIMAAMDPSIQQEMTLNKLGGEREIKLPTATKHPYLILENIINNNELLPQQRFEAFTQTIQLYLNSADFKLCCDFMLNYNRVMSKDDQKIYFEYLLSICEKNEALRFSLSADQLHIMLQKAGKVVEAATSSHSAYSILETAAKQSKSSTGLLPDTTQIQREEQELKQAQNNILPITPGFN